MPILWPLTVPERGNAKTQRKTLEMEHSCLFIHHTIWIYLFPHLILFNTPKKSLLKSSYPSQIFVPKKILESKISNPKKSFDHPRHLKSWVHPWGPPTPRLLQGICPPCQSCGWGISKFCVVLGLGICQPLGHPQAFDTHMVSYPNITKHGGFYWNHKQVWQGEEKLGGFQGMFSWFYAWISSQKSGAIDVNQRIFFLATDSNFCSSRILIKLNDYDSNTRVIYLWFEEHPFTLVNYSVQISLQHTIDFNAIFFTYEQFKHETIIITKNCTLKCLKWNYWTLQSMKTAAVLISMGHLRIWDKDCNNFNSLTFNIR